MLISAFSEVVSLGAVLPFIGILIAPDQVFNHPVVSGLARGWDINSADELMLPLTIAFAFAALAAGGIRVSLMWASTRLAYAGGADLSIEVYRRTLYQPYRVHVARNSSEVISGITTKVHSVVFDVLTPLLILISSAVLMLSITTALIVIKPIVAVVVTGGFGASYGLITWLSKRRLHRNSQRIAYEQTQVVKALQEGLGGIRDVLLDGTQPVYCNIYQDADLALRQAQASNSFVASSPRYLMEAMGMVLIAALAYALSRQPGGVASALPVLAALALGAQRLLPALQQSYNSWTTVAGCEASLVDILELLDQPLPEDVLQPVPAPLPFQSAIRFDAVYFRYSNEGPLVLDGLDLVIPKGARVGFVGSTGSGKSTTLDLLMGLLTPTEGRLLVDDQPVTGNKVRAWQQSIAHVPQSIYLADTTLAENIAFGVPRHEIDMERVKKAARQAHIAEFIEDRPDGYDAFVGERGIRLSGGQRQRIGIARALYKQASVLVFDEATSSLDNATEQSVIGAIEGLNRDLTILMIAHRLTTVRRCDIIVELEQGRVVAQGTYDELLQSSASFRSMATLTE
jgi:ATP-binding cassette subfamily B protein